MEPNLVLAKLFTKASSLATSALPDAPVLPERGRRRRGRRRGTPRLSEWRG
jgi:hypothetical protein